MLADLNTKSHPAVRLTLLRTLWGIEGPEEVEVKKVVVKAFRASQQPMSTARGSNDPGPSEELGSTTSSSQSTKEKRESTLKRLDRREQEIRLKYLEMSANYAGILSGT